MLQAEEDCINDMFATCQGAYSPRTVSGYKSDLLVFRSWCRSRNHTWLPASPTSIAEFVDHQVDKHCLSTIKRRLCAIAFAHRLSDLPVPTEHNAVRLAVRRASRQRPRRPKQVRGLTSAILAKVIAACPDIGGFTRCSAYWCGLRYTLQEFRARSHGGRACEVGGGRRSGYFRSAFQIRRRRRWPYRLSFPRNCRRSLALA